jgi:hypothetical protein
MVGETLSLSVELSHECDQVVWLCNGKRIDLLEDEEGRFKTMFSSTIQCLELLKVDYSFAGRYTIQADRAEVINFLYDFLSSLK